MIVFVIFLFIFFCRCFERWDVCSGCASLGDVCTFEPISNFLYFMLPYNCSMPFQEAVSLFSFCFFFLHIVSLPASADKR